MFRPLMIAALTMSMLLAGCESSEERAEAHFQEGLALLEAGDVDRAIVEFRNVFQLNGLHREVRRAYADAEIGRGNVTAGYRQYLRLIEQYPDDKGALRELTRIALKSADWSQIEKYAPQLIAAEPDDEVGKLADIGMRYRKAVESEDDLAQAEIAKEAEALRDSTDNSVFLSELLADYYTRQGRRELALRELTRAIEADPTERRLQTMRLALLQEMGDLDGVESHLREMVESFPDDPAVPATLVRWYLSQGNLDAAESFLRERAEELDDPAADVDLLQFTARLRGPEAAIAEIDRLMAEGGGENEVLYRSMRAGLLFETGQAEEAIALMEELLASTTEETDQMRNVKVALARMLSETGNQVGSRALVEEVLESDPNHVEALKMQASSLILADETDTAILTIRRALEQSPRDPDLMTLMAQAYERGGKRELMGEMLSLAAEASNSAPEQASRYARYLIADGKSDVAEGVLIDALRLNPNSLEMLQLLGSIYVARAEWSRAEQVRETIADLDSEDAAGVANSLQAQILSAQGRTDDVVGFLEQLVDSGEGGIGAQVAIVRTYIQNGDIDLAQRYVEERLQADAAQPTLRFLQASIMELRGQTDAAEDMYRTLLDESPDAVLVWRALYLLQSRDGRGEAAAATLDEALAANPEAADLLWIKATNLQNSGDLEGALEIYEAMYDRNSSAPIIANNYASLLTLLREDQESIDRAYSVARRLQGMDVPAFQDTFGWIAYLRGDYPTALDHLEPAAEALADDPTVQYHLAMTYAALDRNEDAVSKLKQAIELAGDGTALPQLEAARQRLAELTAK